MVPCAKFEGKYQPPCRQTRFSLITHLFIGTLEDVLVSRLFTLFHSSQQTTVACWSFLEIEMLENLQANERVTTEENIVSWLR